MTLSARLALVRDAAGVRAGDRVLEVGCGQGALVGALAEQVGDGHVVGLDRSARMVEVARRVHAEHVEAGRASFVQARVQDLDASYGPFDVVVAARVREVWTDPAATRTVRGLLRAGGRLALVVDSPAGPPPAALLVEVERALEAAGFRDVARRGLDATTVHVGCWR